MIEKYTKIVATIGPASFHPETITGLIKAGMNVARVNLSHGDRASQKEYIKNIRQLDPNFPILLDTKGPEIRTGQMYSNPLYAKNNMTLRLISAGSSTRSSAVPVDYPYLNEIAVGSKILFDDGLVESEVIKNNNTELVIKIINDGPIGTGKKVTIQGYLVKLPFLTDRDKDDLSFAINNEIQLIAASFVRSAEDIRSLRSYLESHQKRLKLISKIEHSEAVANLDSIIRQSDGIMVARGDLGVELPLQEIPGIQEKIIKRCNQVGKPVIVATQMLESMRDSPRPTRAEVNDVANAILQGADAIMLSAETATGRYPIRSVEMMSVIAQKYEKNVKGIVKKYRRKEERGQTEIAQYIAKAAFSASGELEAKAILTPTETGFTPRNVSRFKPKCPILASTKDPMVVQLLHMVWGVSPMLDTKAFLDLNHYDMSYQLIRYYIEVGMLSMEDRIIITSGSNLMAKRGTNLLEIYTVGDIIRDKVEPVVKSSGEIQAIKGEKK
jgi:pyruvate kinase